MYVMIGWKMKGEGFILKAQKWKRENKCLKELKESNLFVYFMQYILEGRWHT